MSGVPSGPGRQATPSNLSTILLDATPGQNVLALRQDVDGEGLGLDERAQQTARLAQTEEHQGRLQRD